MPFRNSVLTKFLKESLGGNSKTTLLCTSSKMHEHYDDSISTFSFAQRAKAIKNKVHAHVSRSPEEMVLLIARL